MCFLHDPDHRTAHCPTRTYQPTPNGLDSKLLLPQVDASARPITKRKVGISSFPISRISPRLPGRISGGKWIFPAVIADHPFRHADSHAQEKMASLVTDSDYALRAPTAARSKFRRSQFPSAAPAS